MRSDFSIAPSVGHERLRNYKLLAVTGTTFRNTCGGEWFVCCCNIVADIKVADCVFL